jgi:transcriptional regulator with XRE-family HTH domain
MHTYEPTRFIGTKRMDFGTFIRQARTSSGLSQAELANRAGLSIGVIYELEARGNGTVALLTKLCTALDLRLTGLPRRPNFAQQVRVLRLRRGWSQEKLAMKAKVSAPAIMRLERGNARVATLSAALDVLAPEARIRKPELAQWRAGTRDRRFTPQEVLERVHNVIGAIDLDPAAHRESSVIAQRYFYEEDDGLSRNGRVTRSSSTRLIATPTCSSAKPSPVGEQASARSCSYSYP